MDDVSGVLGAYLLKGWTMSDEMCPRTDCPGVPLMKRGNSSFCARCDGPPSPMPQVAAPVPASPSATTDSSSAHSTAITSQKTADDLPIVPIDPQTQLLRRQQSDLAAQRIGELLLKGWALLGEECTNNSCWGVPLMGYPRSQNKAGRSLCVICRREYLDGHVVSETAPASSFTAAGVSELNSDGNARNVMSGPLKSDRKGKGKARAKYDLRSRNQPSQSQSTNVIKPQQPSLQTVSGTSLVTQPAPSLPQSTNSEGVKQAMVSLDRKLGQLADMLDSTDDLRLIGDISTALAKCGDAMSKLKAAA